MIYIRELLWNNWNIEHIAEHNVSLDEVEEVCYNNPFVTRARNKTLRIIGQTDAGRFLTIFVAPQAREDILLLRQGTPQKLNVEGIAEKREENKSE